MFRVLLLLLVLGAASLNAADRGRVQIIVNSGVTDIGTLLRGANAVRYSRAMHGVLKLKDGSHAQGKTGRSAVVTWQVLN